MTRLGRGLAALCLLLVFAAPLAAQENPAAWQAAADAAEAAIADPESSDDYLTAIRADLARTRSEAQEVQTRSADRIATLQAQIAALGPAPRDGETEAADIATRRAELGELLARVRAPVLDAETAYHRAEGLIAEIDALLRDRTSERLLRRAPSPLLPDSLAAAARDAALIAGNMAETSHGAMVDPVRRETILSRLPAFLLALAAAALLLTVVRRKMVAQASEWLDRRRSPAGRAAGGFLLNLFRLAIPYLAALAVVTAAVQVNPGGPVFDAIAASLPVGATALIAAMWLSNAIFSPDRPGQAVLSRSRASARRGRRHGLLLGLWVAVFAIVSAVAGTNAVSEAARGLFLLPVLLPGAWSLFALGSVMADVPHGDGEGAGMEPAVQLGGRLTMLAALAIPLAAVAGYVNLAEFLFQPTAISLALIFAMMVIFSILRDSLDLWLTGEGDEARRHARARFRLVPVAIGFGLAAVAAPILVLVWGARVTDLEEIWIWMRDGVAIGDNRLSVTDVLAFVAIFGAGYTLTRILQSVFRISVLPRTDLDLGGRNAIITGIGYVGIITAAFLAISSTGLSLSNLAIVAGALSVGIGFGLQAIVSNFVSGVILLVERPIKEGDWIEVAGFSGYVRRISVRSTRIETFDRSSVIVPNQELIAGTVLNYTHDNLMGRMTVPVGVAYGSDTRLVERILKEIATSHEQVLRTPAPNVFFTGFGEDSLNFEIRAYLRDINYIMSVRSEMNHAIYEAFRAEGVEIPFRQTDIHIRNIAELRGLTGRETQDDGDAVS